MKLHEIDMASRLAKIKNDTSSKPQSLQAKLGSEGNSKVRLKNLLTQATQALNAKFEISNGSIIISAMTGNDPTSFDNDNISKWRNTAQKLVAKLNELNLGQFSLTKVDANYIQLDKA